MLEARGVFLLVLLAICCHESASYRFNALRRMTSSAQYSLITSPFHQSRLSCSVSAAGESEADMDRLLIENDDNDGDEDGSPPPTIEEIETELEELDINMIAESDIDRSIQNAVRKLVDSGPKEIELSRVETFENIYKVRKM